MAEESAKAERGLVATEEPLAELKSRFEEGEGDVRITNYRRGALLAAIFVLGGVTLDLMSYPTKALDFFYLRLACTVLLLGVLVLLYVPSMKPFSRVLGHLVAFLPMIMIDLMIWWSGDGGESPYYAGLNLVLVGAVLLLRWRFSDSVVNGVMCIGGFVAVAMATGTDIMVAGRSTFFLFVTAFFASVGVYHYNRLRFAEFCLREEVVAQRKKVEAQSEKLAENHRKLQELDESKTRFFANISHELRTPLTLILAPVEKMRNSNPVRNDPALMELVNSLEDNGMRLLRLINDLLDLVRLDSGEMPMRPERFRVATFIDGLGRNLQPTAERKRINLAWSAECDDENCEVFLDRDRLEKIVLNLSVNALKFTPPSGQVSLKAGIRDEHLFLEVADNGAGMRPDQLNSAFERFWQADTSARKKHRGVGIGLALVKSLTESMQGEVNIESVYGEGTTFTITVPLVDIPADEEEPGIHQEGAEAQAGEGKDAIESLHERARLQGAIGPMDPVPSPLRALNLIAPGRDPSAKREQVLIAEDDPGLRRFLRGELEELGCEVIEACDGAEAWKLAKQFDPALLITDYMMPEMDGITLTYQLREHDATSQLPILLVTAAADETPRIEALEAGVSDFLTKPFTTAELRLRVRNLLDRQQYQRELGVKNRALGEALDEIKENEARLLQAEKLSALGTMSAGIVHEVNNPLNYAKTALHALRMYSEDVGEEEREDFEETVGDAEEGVNRVIRIVSDLRSFTKGEITMKEEVGLAESIEMARRFVSEDLRGIEFEVNIPQSLTVRGNSNQLCQVFVNLIQNAAQALAERCPDDGAKPTIDVHSKIIPDDQVMLVVRDNGPGIAKEDLDHIFDPFFTRREVGEGMGMGLSICHRIVESHQGRLNAESVPGEFTEFRVTLPRPWSDRDEPEEDMEGNSDPGVEGEQETDLEKVEEFSAK